MDDMALWALAGCAATFVMLVRVQHENKKLTQRVESLAEALGATPAFIFAMQEFRDEEGREAQAAYLAKLGVIVIEEEDDEEGELH